MKNYKLIVLVIVLVVFIIPVFTFAQTNILNQRGRQTSNDAQDVKGKVNTLQQINNSGSGNLMLLGNVWQVTECCGWSGTWTRRPNTNTFDCVWKHTNGSQAKGTVELSEWNTLTNQVTILRSQMNGYYKAIYYPANKTLMNGSATWYQAGASWSATIR